MFEAFQPSLLPTKLVTNVKQIGFAFGSSRIDQFSLKQSYPISHLLRFRQPYFSNPAQAAHIKRSPSMQHGVASEKLTPADSKNSLFNGLLELAALPYGCALLPTPDDGTPFLAPSGFGLILIELVTALSEPLSKETVPVSKETT
ncbi:hypothetical protein RFM99_10840 [Mesorhizobium sp. VK4C]|uniref:hypothetical protein n=1 Tax=Mesorhizobium captivum TaxID=3072319 RepID=UPI002A244003|nr:hypothetical protein [Mesorhizobium sp. VK4C]MDX8498919.1 hypothetical protein [Mesorhizobium sp. VK4C]